MVKECTYCGKEVTQSQLDNAQATKTGRDRYAHVICIPDPSHYYPHSKTTEKAYFLTVDWCNKGDRGVFCSYDVQCFRKDGEPHTKLEMQKILGPFWLILSPKSEPFTIKELAGHNRWRPLAEYSGEFGIALKPEEEK